MEDILRCLVIFDYIFNKKKGSKRNEDKKNIKTEKYNVRIHFSSA